MTDGKPRQGSQSPLVEHVGPVRSWLTRYFRRRIRDENEVEDLVQEVFTRIVARDSPEPVRHLGAYVLKAASSVWSDSVRRARSHRAVQHVSFDPSVHGEDEMNPERIVGGREELNQAVAALLCLPERTRAVFILRRIENQSSKEIAEHFGISVSAVEKHMVRAVRAIRLEMEKHRDS